MPSSYALTFISPSTYVPSENVSISGWPPDRCCTVKVKVAALPIMSVDAKTLVESSRLELGDMSPTVQLVFPRIFIESDAELRETTASVNGSLPLYARVTFRLVILPAVIMDDPPTGATLRSDRDDS